MKKNKIKLFKIYSLILFLIIIIIFLLIGVVKYFFIYNQTKDEYDSVIFKINKEELMKKKIGEIQERNLTDTEVERNILERNMLQRPGEKIIELIDWFVNFKIEVVRSTTSILKLKNPEKNFLIFVIIKILNYVRNWRY